MSNIIKTLLSTISKSLNKRFILGDSINKNPIIVLSTLVFTLDYLQHRYKVTGDKKYKKKIKDIESKINFLKKHCGEICENKNRFIINKGNTPPTIEDNEITILIGQLLAGETEINYTDFIHNYIDKESNNISQIVFKCLEGSLPIFVNGEPLELNKPYPANSTFSFNKDTSDKEYFINNVGDADNCIGELISVDKDFMDTYYDYNILNLKDVNGNIVLQKLNGMSTDIPNDTLMYVHLDTTSLNPSEIIYLGNFFKNWWTIFKSNNPTFNGSFIVNTIDNDQLSNDYAIGRGDHKSCEILEMNTNFNIISPGSNQIFTEAWLKNPTEGLLRQAYKEGENNFTLTSDFLSWIDNKSLVVLSFIDESEPIYHNNGVNGTPPDYTNQPTQAYIDDYTFFMNSIYSNLKLFKGVLYPVYNLSSDATTNFMLQSISAIEARNDMTLLELKALVGPTNDATFSGTFRGVVDVLSKIQVLMTGNVYTSYGQLKNLGWSGDFTNQTPISNKFNEPGTINEITELLTSTEELRILDIDIQESPVVIEDPFSKVCIKVKDDHPTCPLYSNEAEITLNMGTNCAPVPDCGKTGSIDTSDNPEIPLMISDDMLMKQNGVEYVKITHLDDGCIIFYADGGVLTNDDLPVVFSRQQLQDGVLTVKPDGGGYCEVLIHYESSFDNHNYCSNGNTFLVKWTYL